jgi:hypothetical protein
MVRACILSNLVWGKLLWHRRLWVFGSGLRLMEYDGLGPVLMTSHKILARPERIIMALGARSYITATESTGVYGVRYGQVNTAQPR